MTDDIRLRDLFGKRVRGAATTAWIVTGFGAFVGGSAFATGNWPGVATGIALIGVGIVALRDVQRAVMEVSN